MTVNPPTVNKGYTQISVASGTSGQALLTATIVSGTTWPNNYVENSSFNIQVTYNTSGVGAFTNFAAIAVVEDSFDVGGNYVTTTGGSTLSPGVLAFLALNGNASMPNGTNATYTIGNGLNGVGASDSRNAALTQFGTFRLVAIQGSSFDTCLRMADTPTGPTSTSTHFDSDQNTANGGASLRTGANSHITGAGGVKCKLTAASRTAGNWSYPQQITASFTLKSAINGTSGPYSNATLKNVRACWSSEQTPTSSIIKETSDTIDTTGVIAIPATNIDTAWGQVVGGSSFYTQLGVGQNFGDVSIPANEKAGIYSIGTQNATDNEQMAYVFQSTTQATGYINSTTDANRRLRTNTADQLASAAIQASVISYREAGRTNQQNLFNRRGTINTTNAIPFLRGIFTNAYNTALPNGTTLILSTRTKAGANPAGAGDIQENTQTLDCAGGTGTIDWSYTIAANHAALNFFIKPGTARVAGSHVATGPDLAAAATFNIPGANAQYVGPFAAYPKDVLVTGNEFAGVNEPSIRKTNIFGVNSEIIFEDMWTGSLANIAMDANGVPTGPGNRNFVIPNSAKCKTTTEINEGSVRVINLSEFNPKGVAGIPVDLSGAEFLEGRRALWDVTATAIVDAGTNLSTSTRLDTPLGYATGTNSLDTIASPSDPASFAYYQGWKDTAAGNEATEDATGFLLTTDITNVGFQTDIGNFGYFRQAVAWVNPDLSLSLKLTPRVVQSDPTLTVRHGIKVFRVTADAYLNPTTGFVDVHPDEAPIYVVYGLNADGSQTQLTQGSATPIGTPSTTADYYFDVTVPSVYFAISVFVSARVSGSPVAGGSQSFLQVGYTFDAVAFATGLPFK